MNKRDRQAFTRLELLVTLTSVTLLGSLALSVLGNGATKSDIAVCANNLRQVGRAFHMWASDHGGENPWWVDLRNGGLYLPAGSENPPTLNVPGLGNVPWAARNNTWLHFAYINQELRTPEPLLCPADQNRPRASEFSTNPTNGYFHLNFRDRAISYFIGLHAFSRYPSSILSGDRSIKVGATDVGCSAIVGTAAVIVRYYSFPRPAPPGSNGWVPGLHHEFGNILLNDGHVQGFSPNGLFLYLQSLGGDNEDDHALIPH